jgi:hypothetical protein
MATAVAREQRACPRVAVALDVRLGRKVGNDVIGRSHDLSASGARVVTDRPLRIDEELEFALDLPHGAHLTGTVRVLRQHRHDMYALRFEHIEPRASGLLGDFVDARAHGPARAS